MKVLFLLIPLIFIQNLNAQTMNSEKKLEKITLGAGCFWCVEAVYQELKGVEQVRSGYMGGTTKNPSYKEVCTGTTGHAEVVEVTYDPTKIKLTEILEVFFKVHDPTTLNRQGGDVGTQYRSVIFYETEEQRNTAISVKNALEKSKIWTNSIVTEICKSSIFYVAEDYHQDYYNLNADKNPYCSMVITPKLEKFKKVFSDKLKQ